MRKLISGTAILTTGCMLFGFQSSTFAQTKGQSKLISSPPKISTTGEPQACATEPLGTTVHWISDPKVAAEEAKSQNKLLFVIHVSGNFAKQEFT